MGGNPYTGKLERFDRAEDIPPTHAGPFRIGELLPWKGFWFAVKEITPTTIVLESRGSQPQSRPTDDPNQRIAELQEQLAGLKPPRSANEE